MGRYGWQPWTLEDLTPRMIKDARDDMARGVF